MLSHSIVNRCLSLIFENLQCYELRLLFTHSVNCMKLSKLWNGFMVRRQCPDSRSQEKTLAFKLEKKNNLVIFVKDTAKIPCVFCQNIIVAIAIVDAAGDSVLSVHLKYLPLQRMKFSNIYLSPQL